jgi:dynactin complex subunit
MTMGDRIKTRQQLLDEQTDANAQATHRDDRHNESARPRQAHDSSVKHMDQDGAEVQGGVDAVRQELEQLRQRMAVIKQEATAEVDRNWASPWRTHDMFDLKVKTRLTGHQEYRSLQDRVRDAMARLPAESDTVTQAKPAK